MRNGLQKIALKSIKLHKKAKGQTVVFFVPKTRGFSVPKTGGVAVPKTVINPELVSKKYTNCENENDVLPILDTDGHMTNCTKNNLQKEPN